MKKFDNFDESVKNKMDGMDFSFSDANWEKMSQVLDATRPAKKPFGKLPLISSIVVGSALIVGSAWYVMTGSSNTKEVAQNTNTAVTVSTNDAKVTSTNVSLNSNTSENSNTNSITTNEKTVLLTNPSNEISSSSNSQKDVMTVNNEKNNSVVNTSAKKNSVKRSEKTVPVNSFANSSKTSKTNAANGNEAENSNSTIQLPVGPIEGDRLKTDAKNEKVAEQTNDNSASTQDKNIAVEESDLISLPTVTTNLGQTAETIAAANLVTSALEEKKAWEYVRVKHHTMTLEGGASNSFGWAVNKTRNGNNISPVLGINYMYNIDSRSSLLVGLQYNSIANLGEAKANFSVTSYGFGVNNDVTTYKLNDLHYAVMPLKYIYRINKNNALGFGANMMYLMNARTQIINTKITESNVAPISESRYEFGYGFDQLNKFNAQLAVSYHHSISNKLAINLELNKALVNVVKDYKYFGAKNTNSAPAAIKLSLTYTLFNK